MQKYKCRSEVPDKYKWDLDEFFKSEEDYRKYFKETEKMISTLSQYVGRMKDSEQLYQYLQKSIEIAIRVMNLYGYCYLVNDQELGKSSSIENLNQALQLDAQYEVANSFFAPELLKLTKEEYENLFTNDDLSEYRAYLDDVYRNKEHTLESNEEEIIAKLTSSMNHFSDISSTLLNSENDYGTVTIDLEKVEIATNNYSHLMKNKDPKIRKEVYQKMNQKLSQYATTLANLLNGYVSMNDTVAKMHHFSNAWDRKLFSLRFPNQIFKSLVHATESNLSILHQYYRTKKKALGLDVLHPYDLYLKPLENNIEYSIEDAQDMVLKAISVLGEDYTSKFEYVFSNRFIDYCQYKGKCNGGYNLSTLDKNSRILMSFNGDLLSVSTIAHEGGHHVNHQYITKSNPPQYRDLCVFVAEVASLTNECLLSNYLLQHSASHSEKMSSLENLLDLFVSNFFGAVREGKMEEEMYHQVSSGLSLTKEFLNDLSYSSIKKYYGNEIELDQGLENGWVRRSHYYMNFYLYSYAICMSVAVICAKKILSKDQEFISKYIQFLSAGSDLTPLDIYKIIDIDLTDEKIYVEAINYFQSLVDQYSQLIAERK